MPVQKDWTQRTPALRLGVGRQPAYYVEAGVSVHRNGRESGLKKTDCFYGAAEFSIVYFSDAGKPLAGIKAGYERSWKGFLTGIEAKRQTGAGLSDWMLTPKAGLTFRGLLTIAYGHNISFRSYPFPRHGRHQISITANLYRSAFLKPKE